MPVRLQNTLYYRTAEVCRQVGISRNTLFRWLAYGILSEPQLRDRRGWRLFTEDQVERLKEESVRIM